MTVSSQLLHRITDPTLPSRERAQLRCQLAKQLEDVGNYDAAREAMGELWAQVGERPVLDGLDESTAGEVLLRVGVFTGWLGSVKQIDGAHETARNLISESLASFETLQDKRKIAEAQMELGHCYWRDGEFDEGRVWLKEALLTAARLSYRRNRGARKWGYQPLRGRAVRTNHRREAWRHGRSSKEDPSRTPLFSSANEGFRRTAPAARE